MKSSIDVCITFDTTGSMYPCLTQVRRVVRNTVYGLFNDIPDLRMAIIAHGDYCDRGKPYVTKIFNFSNDPEEICYFIENVEKTYGGDAPECYELVLHEARTKLSWSAGRQKVVAMIGDDIPHSSTYPENTLRIDWRNELGLLLEAGINVYGVHAMPGVRTHSKRFYEEIAQKTGGFYLTLDQFAAVPDLIMAICYKQEGDERLVRFGHEVQTKGRMSRNLKDSIRTMRGLKTETYKTSCGLVPVPAGRFQVFEVDRDQDILSFVQDQGTMFKPGRGFYQLSKSVKVQQYKEIILVDKESGDIFNGSQVRYTLGLQPQSTSGGVVERLNKSHLLDKYDVFIQSTSYNRKLIGGTKFMYEVEDWSMSGTRTEEEFHATPAKSFEKVKESMRLPITKSKAAPAKKVTKNVIRSIDIPPRLETAANAYIMKFNNPTMTWDEVAKKTGYTHGSSARRAVKKVEALYKKAIGS